MGIATYEREIIKIDIAMKGKQIVAIDVGSSNVVIAVGAVEEDGNINILGIVSEPITKGVVSGGRIENIDSVGRVIALAKSRIERQLGIHITEAYAGMSGDYVRCAQVVDHVYVQGDGHKQVTKRDIEELHRRMQNVPAPNDIEEILSFEPLSYTVDGKAVDEPCGAYGQRLSATYNFVLAEKSARDRLRATLLSQGITPKEFVPNATVSHLGVATSEEIVDGVVVIDLGGGVTDVTILQGGKVRYIASIPMGADAINRDIHSLTIPEKYVEDLKVGYGSAIAERAEDDIINFQLKHHSRVKSVLRRNLVNTIEARLMDIAELVQREIKEAKCGSRFMPAVLITGGGAKTIDIERLFARELNYEDVRVVYPEYGITHDSAMEHITTPAYSTVTSLLLYGASRGLCAVAVMPSKQMVTPPVTTPAEPKKVVATPPVKPVVADVREVREEVVRPEVDSPVVQGTGTLTASPKDDDDTETDIVEEPGWFKKTIGGLFNKMSKKMSDDEDKDYDL